MVGSKPAKVGPPISKEGAIAKLEALIALHVQERKACDPSDYAYDFHDSILKGLRVGLRLVRRIVVNGAPAAV